MDRQKAKGSRVLLFSQFTLTLDVLEEYCLEKFGAHGYLRLDGSTNRIVREMDVRAFNATGSKVFIYLISTRAGGQGINLASADTVVLYDSCWNPQIDLQAQDRAHRIGQKKQVRVYRLITEQTIEEKIIARARQKLVLDAMVVKGSSGGGMLTKEMSQTARDNTKPDELTLDELYKFLTHGASKTLDPTQSEEGSGLTESDYDRILEEAKQGIDLEEVPHFTPN